ncbi:structural maintenance of chromosomes protein 6 [Monodelphis domestica]|uniref:Structural maintenance of chromosomes protein 6 n=1 Tax=Monodelphis domestica TaxID=13616 RepID=A0A5F8HC33_MONDO|nr:structural maintenance of chromosomes protein 6 [Monodelphis domestica]XP_007506034.1 structural maintenance of chromosomes protein 6 [Monodelphis domestica]XP_007506035.1 structural maintenance of chromosomes protein 6 [Monodelphis domestica]XP_016282615.1 structural maintenance of chromosomes protein 6 [Monodelphis domestica]XP_056665342.1 structural maintenance of chromosomes protein 6 [Monodelphis domestica]XP_056665343.1 structural maintenance of chromosomes protein 6 [Monodelphis dome
MSKRKEDDFPPATDQKRARPGWDSDDDLDFDPIEGTSQGAGGLPSIVSSQEPTGEYGIIESIQLENFMCHASLGPVKFGPSVNFVVGYSGKSTLLTALVVGLGGKSLGTSLKEFVKDGESSANISITLKNKGIDAFKPEVYGELITVHQHINGDGYASYQLKDCTGNVVSNKKAELTAILEHFKIRVDNPVSILPQEMGRQLLRTRNEGERYSFFLKATELEQMREEYSEILERKARSQHQIEQGEEQLEDLKRQGVEIEEHFQTMVTLGKTLEDMKLEMTWAVVSETERQLDDMISNINIGDQCTIILNQELEASKIIFNEALKRYTAIHENIQKLSEEASIIGPQCIQAKEDTIRTDRAYSLALAFYTSALNEYSEIEKVAGQHQSKLEILKSAVEMAELEKQEKISTLKEKIRNFKDQEDSLVEEIKHLHQAIERDDKEHSRVREDVVYVQELLDDDQCQLNRLKDCKNQPLKLFGHQMPALIEALEDAHRQGQFTYKPIGPLGAYLRLRDPEYALAIECCLKGLLFSFFCDNPNDAQILQELIKRFYPLGCKRPQIIVSAFDCELYDVTDRAPYHPEFPTALTALEINDAVVTNSLIDMTGIESVLLIKNNAMARKMVLPHGPPKNCTKVLTACGDEVFQGRYYSCEESRPTYLGDMDMEIHNLEKDMENRMARLSAFQEQVRSLEKDVRENRETIDSHYRHLKEIKINVINITKEIRDLEDEEDSRAISLSVLEDEAQEYNEELKRVREKLKARNQDLESLRKPKLEAEERFEELTLRCNQVSELMESLIEEQNQTVLEVEAKHQSMLHYDCRLKEHLDSLQVKKEEMAMKERELERETAQAIYICPERKIVTKSASVLSREINALKERIQSENYTHRNREDVMRQYQEAKERYLDLDGKVKNLKKLIKTLDKVSTQRYETYQRGRRNLSLQCKLYFDSLVAQWSFCGEMRFDHKNETLAMTVQPSDATSSDLGCLPGDRQSFSNFIFILTLWSVTKSPFRCLDAIDVYMDWDRRKLAMEMILRIASTQNHHQFILLTPQFMRSLLPSPIIEIFQMPDLNKDEEILPLQEVRPEVEDKEAA